MNIPMTRGRRRSLARDEDNLDHRPQVPCRTSREPDSRRKSLIQKELLRRGRPGRALHGLTMWGGEPALRREWVKAPNCHEPIALRSAARCTAGSLRPLSIQGIQSTDPLALLYAVTSRSALRRRELGADAIGGMTPDDPGLELTCSKADRRE